MLKLAALGDLMIADDWHATSTADGLAADLLRLSSVLEREDLVFANLEVTLPGSEGTIPKEPRLIGHEDSLRHVLSALRVSVASLANNHAFDAYWSGFERTRSLLNRISISSLGAGSDSSEASQALCLESCGVTTGWLAYADPGTKPSHMATRARYGVHRFDQARAVNQVRELSLGVDHVIVSLHWGVEYSHLPSPTQVEIARSLIDAGATLVIGHHAHVVQGVEEYRDGLIAYNLGNAIANSIRIRGHLAVRRTALTDSSFVLRVSLDRECLQAWEVIPYRLEGRQPCMNDARARVYFEKANRLLARGITPGLWRRTRFIDDVVLRTLRKLHPAVIRSVGPGHIKKALQNSLSALSGRNPS